MRNQFNLSHEHKTSVDMGQLVPVMCEEVLPGDTFRHSISALARVSPLATPVMHRCELRLHTFYVPNRILWDQWEDFITTKDEGIVKPTYTTTASNEKLLDYMGIPNVAGLAIDALPIQSFNLIWNEYYRDQDLQAERDLLDTTVPTCAWQKDYFTIARPTPQKGDPETIPVGGQQRVEAGAGHTLPYQTDLTFALDPSDQYYAAETGGPGNASGLFVTQEAEINIDDLRRSIALQRFAEARMRFGSRYVDYLRYIGVNPSDGRLDRPEYLGGGKETLSFSEVLQQTSLDSAQGTVGEMYGHGIGMGMAGQYQKMFEEHGWVITLMSIRPKTVYQQALPRKFTRTTAMDYWQKELEVLPWQEVKTQEVYAPAADATTVFGYVPRYEEYRHSCSVVSSTLRGGTEEDWHLARKFDTEPVLNSSFVECTPSERIYQDANQPNLIVNVLHNIKARRFVGQTASMGTDL